MLLLWIIVKCSLSKFLQTLRQFHCARNNVTPCFKAGTGNIADAVGLGAALDYLERIGAGATHGWSS
nr:aminotransferase class V-fold PLP-dependent enzyme [Candidatus Contendobacter odensis]